jgi:hypothetical protein
MRKGDDLSLQTMREGEIVFGLIMNYEGGQILQHWKGNIGYEQLQ